MNLDRIVHYRLLLCEYEHQVNLHLIYFVKMYIIVYHITSNI